jgi:hypothetical protein
MTRFKLGDKVMLDSNSKKEPLVDNCAIGTVVKVSWNGHDDQQYEVQFDGLDTATCRVTLSERELIAAEDPVPGKYYRNRAGRKVRYIGQGSDNWFIYEYLHESGAFSYLGYRTAYAYYKREPSLSDIVGEWKDEVVIPATTVKKWVLVGANILEPSGLVKPVLYDSHEAAMSQADYYHKAIQVTIDIPERKVQQKKSDLSTP